MNIKQRIIVLAGAVAMILLLLWPPCKDGGGGEAHQFVFSLDGYHIYQTKLAVYAGLVLLVSLGLVWALHSPRK